jgi:hypothetical protein
MSDPLPPPSTAPKQRSGCLLAFYIAAGLAALCIVTTALGVWLFMRSERGQKLVKVINDGVTLGQQALTAPGTEALRAAGCTQAMVISGSEVVKLLSEFAPEAAKDIPSSLQDSTLVMCQIGIDKGEGPDCTHVATVYAGAAPEAPDRFGVMVQQQRVGRATQKCQGSYARDGTFLGPLEPPKAKQR